MKVMKVPKGEGELLAKVEPILGEIGVVVIGSKKYSWNLLIELVKVIKAISKQIKPLNIKLARGKMIRGKDMAQLFQISCRV